MKKLDYISGLVLLGFSVVLFFAAQGLPLMDKYGPSSGFFPTILSVILAYVLGPMLERSLRQALMYSDGSMAIFFTQPISASLLAIAFCSLLFPVFSMAYKKMKTDVLRPHQ